MDVGKNLSGFNISAKGLSLQRRRMNLIAENIANAENIRTADGKPYQRKFMVVSSDGTNPNYSNKIGSNIMKLRTKDVEHLSSFEFKSNINHSFDEKLNIEVIEDSRAGELIFMPNHPDADENGFVEMSNVNIVEEMVEMIAATRSYEANLTAFNASKEMAKDSLEI